MKKYKAGFIGLIGEPNAGKSTLMNLLLGEKVSIVSDKPQTTRRRVHGIMTLPDAQIIFLDAPGLLSAKVGLNGFLAEEARAVAGDADALLILVAADAPARHAEAAAKLAKESGKPWQLLVTKSDLLNNDRGPRAMPWLLEEKVPFVAISALKREEEAKEEVMRRILEMLPEAPAPLYDADLYTTQTLREMASEIVRERCFENYRQEIPYGIAVKTVEFKEQPEAKAAKISCEIWVDKESHKAIVIGAKGASLKKIGIESRAEIERLIGRHAFLELRVVAKPGWAANERWMKELGYVIAN